MKNIKPKFIITIMFFVILLFSSSVVMYRGIVKTVEDSQKITDTQLMNTSFDSIYLYLNELIEDSQREINKIGSNIEETLLRLPTDDFVKIQEDMSNNIHNDTLHSIITHYTQGECLNSISNYRNGIIVMSSDGILEDYNYRRAKSSIESSDGDPLMIRSWEEDNKRSYNKKLDKDGLDKLLNRTSGIIAFESYNLIDDDKKHMIISELNYYTLKEVYKKEGLEGLRNYQIYVPYYITDSGDIFGQPDISHGVKQDNNKIILVQEFNLWDQINNNDSFMDNSMSIELIHQKHGELLRLLYIFGIAMSAAICGMIFYFCTLYNKAIISEQNETEDEEQECMTLDDLLEDDTK